MKGRKKQAPAAPPETVATPFFVRFLEGQQPEEDAEATVSERAPRAQYTTSRGAKKPAAKKGGAKKGGAKKGGANKGAAKIVTLKYPSDRDEIVFYPYHAEAARIGPGSGAQTMKAPSDNDEFAAFAATYVNRKDVPAAAKVKPKAAPVNFTSPSKDLLEDS
jgi:Serine endopeptidase inhibitors